MTFDEWAVVNCFDDTAMSAAAWIRKAFNDGVAEGQQKAKRISA